MYKNIIRALAAGVFLQVSCKEPRKEPEAVKETPGDKESPDHAVEISEEIPVYMEEGKKLYTRYCLVCHQPGGGGVSGLNPPLKGTEYVLGDSRRLIGILLNGSNVGLVINGLTYSNTMPSFAALSDKEIALLASFIRNSFGNSANPVSAEEVASVRASIGR